jgi:hypothetical protein
MARAPIQAGMKKTDIEQIGITLGIIPCQIVQNNPRGKTLAVDGNTEMLQDAGFGFFVGKQLYIIGKIQSTSDLAGGVMVTGDHEDLDAGLPQTPHPIYEINAGIIVLPVSVIEIPNQQDKGNLLINSQFHKVIKIPPCRTANLFHRGILINFKTL